jgi:hypothetical protein
MKGVESWKPRYILPILLAPLLWACDDMQKTAQSIERGVNEHAAEGFRPSSQTQPTVPAPQTIQSNSSPTIPNAPRIEQNYQNYNGFRIFVNTPPPASPEEDCMYTAVPASNGINEVIGILAQLESEGFSANDILPGNRNIYLMTSIVGCGIQAGGLTNPNYSTLINTSVPLNQVSDTFRHEFFHSLNQSYISTREMYYILNHFGNLNQINSMPETEFNQRLALSSHHSYTAYIAGPAYGVASAEEKAARQSGSGDLVSFISLARGAQSGDPRMVYILMKIRQ